MLLQECHERVQGLAQLAQAAAQLPIVRINHPNLPDDGARLRAW